MKVYKVKDYQELSKKSASIVAEQIKLKSNSILGLATGSTPEGMYKELIELYEKNIVDFSDVTTFNLDEYYGLYPEDSQSYNYYMRKHLLNHINIKEENINIPNGMAEDIEKSCEEYENKIKELGGIDLQLLGIGRNGHIGFNEPSDSFETYTRLVELDIDTINANSRFFASLEEVPTKAISMGIQTIMNAKKILLIASGESKAKTIYDTIKGPITPSVPASILQLHKDVTIIVDEEAGKLL
ncbi:glucosamine-6-phosphate deaminase NagB [Gottschalkia purinilytica]|uniref:Glucosamine-6-phosphate deaminase n=1 Tax=Gottschalkia purinilytica TaxID=1503 RepID=A0A0L0W9N4_GOTPU|nr:glucosamine-6-phosphate deaminase [Gottschalkia purinilytica]KNF08157.1 glucosamine-6-phosphate deaminase NagB [Gottschalkia purinilytica]